jgi:glycerol-3-phosphate acyltransferase PlsX
MRIGIDIMGGDHAPLEIVKGAILAQEVIGTEAKLVLFGDEAQIKSICEQNQFNHEQFDIVHTTEIIEMHEHPAKAFQAKANSSITKGFEHLAYKKIDAFASVGNTGAMLVGAMMVIKPIEGIIRPCISTHLPKIDGKDGLLLDVGINPDCKPEVLLQYGILGSVYAEEVYGISNPKVALLNIGSEEGKGNILARAAYDLMKESKSINFVGNVEGSDLFRPGVADVIVTDGFTGNIVLKQSESLYRLALKRGINDEYFNRFNFELYGGTPVLGINQTVIIGHGVSKATAIKNMITHTMTVVKAQMALKITSRIAGTN